MKVSVLSPFFFFWQLELLEQSMPRDRKLHSKECRWEIMKNYTVIAYDIIYSERQSLS